MMRLLLIAVLSTIFITNGRSRGKGGSSGGKGSSKGGGGSGSGDDYGSSTWSTTASSGSDYSSTSRSDDDSASNTGSGSGDYNDYSNTGVSGGWSNGGSSGDNDEDERSIYCWETDRTDGRRHRRRRGKGGRKGGRKSGWKGSYKKSKGKGSKSSYKSGRKGGRKSGGGGGDDEDSGSSATWSTTSDIELSSTDYDSMESPEPSSTFPTYTFSSTLDECDDYNSSSIWSTTDYYDDMSSTDYDDISSTDRDGADDDITTTPNGGCERINIEACFANDVCTPINDPVCCGGNRQWGSLCIAVNCECEDESQCIQGTCSDDGGGAIPLCPENPDDLDDVNTPCECFSDCEDGYIALCPTGRCIAVDNDAECSCNEAPADAQMNSEGQADGLLFGDSLSKGETVGVLGGMIAGIALIICCLIVGGFLYCKKKNNKYGNIAEMDDNDGRADDIGVEGVAMTATNERTQLDGEDEDEDGDAIGHETGKTQTIIQYDSSDDDGDMALPENNETKLR